MRIAFVGASKIAVLTTQLCVEAGHDVVIIEKEEKKIDELSKELDCSFLKGDGSRPAILKEVGPEQTDVLFCLSDNDQANIIASLVGRSLGFKRVVTSIENPEYASICGELGLEDTIIPSQTISRFLTDMLRGIDVLELSTLIKDQARFFTFVAREEDEGKIEDLKLPEKSRVICFYRDGKFNLADDNSKIKKADEVVILTHSDHLSDLEKRWSPEGLKTTQKKPAAKMKKK